MQQHQEHPPGTHAGSEAICAMLKSLVRAAVPRPRAREAAPEEARAARGRCGGRCGRRGLRRARGGLGRAGALGGGRVDVRAFARDATGALVYSSVWLRASVRVARAAAPAHVVCFSHSLSQHKDSPTSFTVVDPESCDVMCSTSAGPAHTSHSPRQAARGRPGGQGAAAAGGQAAAGGGAPGRGRLCRGVHAAAQAQARAHQRGPPSPWGAAFCM